MTKELEENFISDHVQIKQDYDTKELEKIVEDSIKEAEQSAELFTKDFEDFKKMDKKPMNSIKDYLLEIRREILTNRSENATSERTIKDLAETNNKEIKKVKIVVDDIKGNFNKIFWLIVVMVFLLGILFGVQHKIWSPYISYVIDGLRTFVGWAK